MSTSIDNSTLATTLNERFGKHIISIEESFGILDVVAQTTTVKEFIKALKADEELDFNFLTSLCGIHFPDKKGAELDVVYHLHSLVNNVRMRIHAFLPSSDAVLPTISDVYAAANWLERETYEFYGVKFEGHPDLRVILNVEDIGYHPLLKQYQLVDDTRTDKEDKYFGR